MVLEITAAGFGSGDILLHWGVCKQILGDDNENRTKAMKVKGKHA